MLLIPAIIAFIIDINSNTNSNQSTVTKDFVIAKNKLRDILSYSFIGIVIAVISLPLLTFLVLSFVKQYPTDVSFGFQNIIKASKWVSVSIL